MCIFSSCLSSVSKSQFSHFNKTVISLTFGGLDMAVAVVVWVTLNKYPWPMRGRESSLGLTCFKFSFEQVDGFFEKHAEQ